MGIFSWFSNKNGDDVSPSKMDQASPEKDSVFSKEYEELKNFFNLLIHYASSVVADEKEIAEKIESIKKKTGQNLKDDLLLKDLLTLRYANAFKWFFDFNPPKNQKELEVSVALIERAFQNILEKNKKGYDFSALKKEFSDYTGVGELNFNNLKTFDKNFAEKLAEKMAHIPFETTEGRLAGELHDFVLDLIMTTIMKDQKVFRLEDNTALTEEESSLIKDTVNDSKPTEQDFYDFLDSITCMSFDEAQNAVNDYADFLAECVEARLKIVFFSSIPKSLLPYPPEYLEKALNVVAKHYHEKGDQHKVKLHQEVLAALWSFKKDEEAMTETAERLGDKKWKDMVTDLVKDFRANPSHKNYIENYRKIDLKSIDFDNLDIPTAHKIVKVLGSYLHQAHMLLSILFSNKIPEGFLPFTKDQLYKALDVYITTYKSIEHENANTYAYGKTIIDEDYVSNEIAINELVKSFSENESRDLIISELKKYQINTARKKYIDRLFPTKRNRL